MRLLVAGLAAINSTILFGCCLWQARSQGPLAKKTRAQVRTLCHRWVTLLRHLGLDQYWEEMVDYILSGDHPLVQLFYLFMMIVGYTFFIFKGFPLLEDNPNASHWHRWTSLTLMIWCLTLFVRICGSDPGIIADDTAADRLVSVFPFDEYYFPGGRQCATCEFENKHCAVCDICVAKFDHHCIWVRNCIGLLNWRLFLLFVFCHWALCSYGSWLIYRIVSGQLIKDHIWEAIFYYIRGDTAEMGPSIVIEYAIGQYPFLCGLGFCLGFFGLILMGFFVFHTWLHLFRDQTTNEFARRPLKTARRKRALKKRTFHDRIMQDFFPRQWLQQQALQSKVIGTGQSHHSMVTRLEATRRRSDNIERRSGGSAGDLRRARRASI